MRICAVHCGARYSVRIKSLQNHLTSFGSDDQKILLWADREQRLLISRDVASLFTHLADHLQAGHHSPGIFMIRRRCAIPQVVAFLIEASYRSEAKDWENQIEYIP